MTKTGISRSVLVWYSAYGGYASTASFHQLSRSAPEISRAVPVNVFSPSCTVTAGLALTLKYHYGCFGSPPLEATMAYFPSDSTRISGT